LIVLVLTLVAFSSYSQYPKTRIIGKDSVVIMTVAQGNEINTLYKRYRAQIDSLNVDAQANKLAIDSLQYKCDSLSKRIYDALQYKWKYEANREIYFKREETIQRDEKYHVLQKMLLVGLVIFQFFQLK
jgi:hypothetical protein